MVEALVERDERAVHARLDQVVGELLQSDRLRPLDDALVRPDDDVTVLRAALLTPPLQRLTVVVDALQ